LVKKLDNSQLIASQLIKKSFEESLSDNNKALISNESKFNKMLHDYRIDPLETEQRLGL